MSRRSWFCLLFIAFLSIGASRLQAQSTAASQSATQELTLLQQALWGNSSVNQANLSGTATWYAGSSVEQGTVTLTATASGSSSVDLSLGDADRKVTATDIGAGQVCEWSNGQTSHQMGFMNCLKPLVWFLPGITLQANLMPSSIGVNDLGTVQADGMSFTRLQAQAVVSGLDTTLLKESMKRSTMNLDLNPTTLLPARVSYILHPDDGSPTQIRVEVRYSDYRKFGNAEIPYHIKRYINGSLQLDIQINSVKLS